MYKIVVINEPDNYREGFKHLLEIRIPYSEILTFSSFQKDLIFSLEIFPDMVIIDPSFNYQLSHAIIDYFIHHNIIVVVLSMEKNREKLIPLLMKDIQGYLMKNMKTKDLVSALISIFRGDRIIHPFIANVLLQEYQKIQHQQNHKKSFNKLQTI